MELLQVKIEKEEKVEKKFRKSFKKLRKVEEEKLKNVMKHCQRHNGPRAFSLKLELSLQLKQVQIQFSPKDISSYRLNTLGPLCLWQCFIPSLPKRSCNYRVICAIC